MGTIAPSHAQQQVLNLQDADIRAFIQDVSRATGQTFIIDPRVQGRVSVASQDPLSRGELFEVLLSTLRANGLVAVPTGSGAFRIAPEEGAAQQASTAGAGFVTQVFRLGALDSTSAAEVIKPLVGRQGLVLPIRRGNLLVVADYADNLRRIRGLLNQVDQDRSATETVTLRSSSAREIGAVINELLQAPGDDAGSRNRLVSVVVVESSNSLILRGDPTAVRPLLGIIADLDRRAETSADVRVIQLQYANAEQLTPVLQQLVGQIGASSSSETGNATPATSTKGGAAAAAPTTTPAITGAARANIARYPGANAIVIAADAETQRTLAQVIRQLDVRREQVLVEAIVVEVSDDAAKRLGVQFALAGADGSNIPFAATNYSNSSPNLMALLGAAAAEGTEEDSATLDLLRETAARSLLGTTGALLGGYGRNDDALFGFVINAVKSDTASNLLSTPSILTQDNQQATILVGQEVPITTGEVLGADNANPFRTIQRQNVGVQLEVKPQINAGGTVTLFLRQEVSSIAGPVSEDFNELILNKREIATTVSVDDGEIIVLGGLLDQNDRTTVERVPLLGDIPGVGALFRSKAKQKVKTNLMVFIRPTIIRSSADARAMTGPRYGFMRDQQLQRSRSARSELDELVRGYMRTTPPSELPPTPPPPIAPPAQLGTPR